MYCGTTSLHISSVAPWFLKECNVKIIKSNLDCHFLANKTGCTLDSGRLESAFSPFSFGIASYPVVGQAKNHSLIHPLSNAPPLNMQAEQSNSRCEGVNQTKLTMTLKNQGKLSKVTG